MDDFSRTIYVVDDDPAVLDSLAELFSDSQCRVETYATGGEFLARFQPDRIGCLVLDLRIPDMTGLAVLRMLERDDVTIPTVVISAFGDVPSAVEAMKAGAVDFLEKPFDPQRLLQLVREALDRSAVIMEQRRERADFIARLHSLTPRELEVLSHLNDGMSNKEVAIRLEISDKTVSAHRGALLGKLALNSTAELARRLTQFQIELSRFPGRSPSDHGR